jgi:hypothetical protein
MGWFDDHPVLEGLGSTVLNAAGAIPAYGNVLAAGEFGYHAAFDKTDTEADKAQHAANMLSSGVGMIPYVGEVADAGKAVTNAFQTGQRIMGANAEQAPMADEMLAHTMYPKDFQKEAVAAK